MECFDKAMQINSEIAETWYSKGNALYHLGEFEESIECFDKTREETT